VQQGEVVVAKVDPDSEKEIEFKSGTGKKQLRKIGLLLNWGNDLDSEWDQISRICHRLNRIQRSHVRINDKKCMTKYDL
jgi:hypothetical protein